jgi:hypothetical protein
VKELFMTIGSLSIAQSRWRLILAAVVALVLISSALVPLTDTALAQGPNPVRSFLPDDQVLRDETFNVSVTFNATTDGFNAIGLGDIVPSGWVIQVNNSWCTPNADFSNIVGDEAQYVWNGPYSLGQAFTAIYQVTVPSAASPGTHLFSGQLEYYVNGAGPFTEDVGGDPDVTVSVPPTPTPTITPTLAPPPPPPPTAVPTLSQWGLIGMVILFAAFLIWSLRRKWIVSANKSQ